MKDSRLPRRCDVSGSPVHVLSEISIWHSEESNDALFPQSCIQRGISVATLVGMSTMLFACLWDKHALAHAASKEI